MSTFFFVGKEKITYIIIRTRCHNYKEMKKKEGLQLQLRAADTMIRRKEPKKTWGRPHSRTGTRFHRQHIPTSHELKFKYRRPTRLLLLCNWLDIGHWMVTILCFSLQLHFHNQQMLLFTRTNPFHDQNGMSWSDFLFLGLRHASPSLPYHHLAHLITYCSMFLLALI